METIGAQTRHYVYTSGNRLRDIRLSNPHGPIQFRFVHDANGAITEKLDTQSDHTDRWERGLC